MAQSSSKIAPFPGSLDKRAIPGSGDGSTTNDPTKELRTYIEGLQNEARVARLNQEAAEEDRDRLTEEVHRLKMELDAANEARKEVRSVIVERDTLHAALEKSEMMAVELRRRAEGADRQRAQVEAQRDQALLHFKESRKLADQNLAARDEAVRQRDASLRQRAQALRDHEEAVGRLAETHRQIGDLQRALVEAQAGANKSDVEIQKQLLAIRQARDSAAAQAAEFKIRIGELEDKIAELTYDREVSDKATKQAVIEVETMRGKAESDADRLVMLETLQAELAEVGQELTSLREQHAGMQGAKEQLVAQLREFRETHEAMLISNTSHLESTTKERDVLRTRLQERETELQEVRAELAATWAGAMQVTEPEIERLSQELEQMKTRAAEVDSVLGQSDEMTRQREELRLQVIELNAQLENARREIKEIGAQLAEARLQLKLADKGGTASFLTRPSAPAAANSESATAPRDRMEALRVAWAGWKPEDGAGVWDIVREATAFAGSCKAAGQQTAHRVAAKLAALAETMLARPDNVTPRLHAFLGQAIEFLAKLSEHPALDETVHVTGKRVYIVDDDANSSATISQALRAAGLSVEFAVNPGNAIAELSAQGYDLILLDAEMTEFDELALCECIRRMESHAKTPIILITDGTEEAERAPGAVFITKPFLADELALRVLISLLQAQVELV